MLARRNWTREWWDLHSNSYSLVTSEPVLEELNQGNFPNKSKALSLMESVSILPVEQLIIEIVDTYLNRKLMPQNPAGDALHPAVASYHKCDFLLTWNCRHLGNAMHCQEIEKLVEIHGYACPVICTPADAGVGFLIKSFFSGLYIIIIISAGYGIQNFSIQPFL